MIRKSWYLYLLIMQNSNLCLPMFCKCYLAKNDFDHAWVVTVNVWTVHWSSCIKAYQNSAVVAFLYFFSLLFEKWLSCLIFWWVASTLYHRPLRICTVNLITKGKTELRHQKQLIKENWGFHSTESAISGSMMKAFWSQLPYPFFCFFCLVSNLLSTHKAPKADNFSNSTKIPRMLPGRMAWNRWWETVVEIGTQEGERADSKGAFISELILVRQRSSGHVTRIGQCNCCIQGYVAAKRKRFVLKDHVQCPWPGGP